MHRGGIRSNEHDVTTSIREFAGNETTCTMNLSQRRPPEVVHAHHRKTPRITRNRSALPCDTLLRGSEAFKLLLSTSALCLVSHVAAFQKMSPKKFTESTMDFCPLMQKQCQSVQEIKWDQDNVMSKLDKLDWNGVELSTASNKECFYNNSLAVSAYCLNFMKMEIHPGYLVKLNRYAGIIANPASDKDPPVDIHYAAVSAIQNKK